jgi:hypothetical protein
MPKAIDDSQKDDIQGRSLVCGRVRHLHQGVWGHQSTTYPTISCPNRIVVGEICYQTILQGYNATLVKDKKHDFIPYGFHVEFYLVKDTAQAKQEGLSQLEFKFPTGKFCKNDLKGLVLKHASQMSSCWPYAQDKFKDEVFTEKNKD